MKAIKLNAYMETARFPVSLSCSSEILPLPPFSTVSGMIHNACDWHEYHYMNLFISGRGYMNKELKMQWQGGSKFKTITEEIKKRWSVIVEDESDNSYTGWVQSPKTLYYLASLQLEIYIQPIDDELEEVYNSLKFPRKFLSLGRYEDLLRVDDIEIVELQEQEKNEIGTLKMDAYVPEIFVPDNLGSISYNINKKYEYTKKGFRKFNKVRCRYLNKDTKLFCNLFDNDNPIFFT